MGPPSGAFLILWSDVELGGCKFFAGAVGVEPRTVLKGISTRVWGLRLCPGPAGPTGDPVCLCGRKNLVPVITSLTLPLFRSGAVRGRSLLCVWISGPDFAGVGCGRAGHSEFPELAACSLQLPHTRAGANRSGKTVSFPRPLLSGPLRDSWVAWPGEKKGPRA